MKGNMVMRSRWGTACVTAALACTAAIALAAPALAIPITFSGTSTNPNSGQALHATVTFVVSGNDLIVTLTNDAAADVLVPTDVLTAVFFKLDGPGLTRTSAVLGGSSTVLFAPMQPAGGVVGGEWAYVGGLSGPNGTTHGISSSGLDLFGPSNRFPGADLQPPDSPDGLQYGLTSAGDNPGTGNAKVTGSQHLIQNSVVFTLSGVPSGFDPSAKVTSVWFQYGTALTEPRYAGEGIAPVPEPASSALLGTALAGLAWARRRRRHGAPEV